MAGEVLCKLKVPIEDVLALLMMHSVQTEGGSRARCFRSFHPLSPLPISLQDTEGPCPRAQHPGVLWALMALILHPLQRLRPVPLLVSSGASPVPARSGVKSQPQQKQPACPVADHLALQPVSPQMSRSILCG